MTENTPVNSTVSVNLIDKLTETPVKTEDPPTEGAMEIDPPKVEVEPTDNVQGSQSKDLSTSNLDQSASVKQEEVKSKIGKDFFLQIQCNYNEAMSDFA